MKGQNWKDIYGAVPREFHLRIEETLEGLEEERMKKHKKRILLVAALIAALLAGTGIAAMRLGLFDMMRESSAPLTPIEGAEDTVRTELGEVENELVKLSVEEAAFDGQGTLVKLRLTPKNAENYALFNLWYQGDPEEAYEMERASVEVEAGTSYLFDLYKIVNEPDNIQLWQAERELEIPESEAAAKALDLPVYRKGGKLYYADQAELRVVGRKDGKSILEYWPEIYEIGAEQAEAMGESGSNYTLGMTQEQPDGSLLIWMSCSPERALQQDVQKLHIGAKLSVEGEEIPLEALEIALPRTDERRRYRIEPVGSGVGGRFRILGGEVVFTHVRGYLTLDYEYDPLPEEEMGIDLRIYDAAGEKINMAGGMSEMTEDGVCRQQSDIQTFAEPPETIFVGAKAVGGAMLEGRVACRLIPQ